MKLSAAGLGKEFLKERRMGDFQFFPATNPKIHVNIELSSEPEFANVGQYVGRWTATPNRLRKDGTFPGSVEEEPT